MSCLTYHVDLVERNQGLVLADDATGALECASILAGLGVNAAIDLGGGMTQGVRVVDTETRHLPPDRAAARIRGLLTQGPIFKKTDSTLRGNISSELLALRNAAPGPIVYIPAYPSLGRTVRNGTLYVHGTPVAETGFANDAREPVQSSRIADLFPPQTVTLIPNADALPQSNGTILLCDAESDSDLENLAAAIRAMDPTPWIAGPAGFVKHWACINGFPQETPSGFPRPAKWLIVCGSRHPQSRRQARHAETLGLPVILAAEETTQSPDEVATYLARQTLQYIVRQGPGALLIMGGDTVFAICREMHLTSLIPLPEILPGIAASTTPSGKFLFVTKAGGFGDDTLVERILERLQNT
ncbi:MAG: hypothetical protein HYX27_21515 [Acidobacteria bacterium]|nr:hypothetical protein [Acidobacteriota bacterium]